MTNRAAALVAGAIPYFIQEIDGRWTDGPRAFAGFVPGSFHPLHRGHLQLLQWLTPRGPAAFELSICNADKPVLTTNELLQRLAQFAGVAPVVVTRAATFVAKAELFPRASFAVGYDTAKRVLDPRYYGDVSAVLARLRAAGCSFAVAGRCDAAGHYVPAAALPVPAAWADLFEPIPETALRADVSGTALRRKTSP